MVAMVVVVVLIVSYGNGGDSFNDGVGDSGDASDGDSGSKGCNVIVSDFDNSDDGGVCGGRFDDGDRYTVMVIGDVEIGCEML